jgi:class 3 adenylate cyclase/tetratricopeptide (TPR) repeat protein
MGCPACGHESAPGARFCGACGERLPARDACAACGAANPPAHKFCHECGAALPRGGDPPAPARSDPRAYTPRHLAERILTSKGAIEGERKHVTVVFADVAGFTGLCEPLDPEQVHEIMDRFFRIVLDQVHRHEGTINQFTGDGVMALFGAPIALEDAPQRAVRAALSLQSALLPLSNDVRTRFGRELGTRVGIHSGPVVVGKIGDDLRMDYTAVGDTTNLAARLQQMAQPGSILISEATEHLVSGFFDSRDLGALGVRGRADPVRAFEVLRERRGRGRIEAAAETGLTPFVGRAREIEALTATFRDAAEGRGQVVFLVGDAGAGKSRLLYELRRRLEGEPHAWFEGRCASHGRDTAFAPLVDGLRRDFGLEDHDEEAVALDKIERAEAEAGGDLAWTLPFLRQLLSLPAGDPALAQMDAATRRSETLRALLARLLRSAERRPLVVTIEDLHWIDAASEEVLGFLIDSIAAARVLILLTHRPGYRHPFDDRSYHQRIAVKPLSEGEMAEMTGSLLAAVEVPAPLRRLIAEKAEGNPFFVEEVTASLLEGGALRREGERIALAGDLAGVSIPDRIQDVLMARIDRLEDEPKRAIQIASVIGREFALRLLEKISMAGEGLAPVVAELRALELIYEKAAHPELAFMFKHALTHEVAYDSILTERRRALHRLVGLAIEELYRDRLPEQYEALAHHFSVGEDWERALLYHERAAEKAADAYANHAAAEHCRRALAIADRLGARAEPERHRRIARQLGRAGWLTSAFRASGDAYVKAAALSARPADRATDLADAARSLQWGHDYERAHECATGALALAEEHDLPAARGAAKIALLFEELTLRGLADVDARRAEEMLLAPATDAETRGWSLQCLGQIADWSGDFRHALECNEQALVIGRRAQLPDLIVIASWFVGKSYCGLGDYGRALQLLGEAIDLSDRIGDRAWQARLLNTRGWCLAEAGAHTRAREDNERATAMAHEMVRLDLVAGAPEIYGNAAINLACNEIALERPERADGLLVPIRDEIARSTDPWTRWRYGMHLADAEARLALAQGNGETTLLCCDDELAAARHHRSRKVEARALELRGRALLAMDARDEAEPTLAAALEVARAIGHPPVTWRALAGLAEIERRRGRASAAQRLAAEAQSCVASAVGSLSDPGLRRGLSELGERAAADPLGALR